jgi:hypothetical protein
LRSVLVVDGRVVTCVVVVVAARLAWLWLCVAPGVIMAGRFIHSPPWGAVSVTSHLPPTSILPLYPELHILTDMWPLPTTDPASAISQNVWRLQMISGHWLWQYRTFLSF